MLTLTSLLRSSSLVLFLCAVLCAQAEPAAESKKPAETNATKTAESVEASTPDRGDVKWWLGEWTVDVRHSQEQIVKAHLAEGGKDAQLFAITSAGGVIGYEGLVFKFTDTEFSVIQEGEDKTQKYEVLNKDKDSVTTKDDSGEETIWRKEGEYLVLTTGSPLVNYYLKPVEK